MDGAKTVYRSATKADQVAGDRTCLTEETSTDLRMAELPMSTQTISEMENLQRNLEARKRSTRNWQEAEILGDNGLQTTNGTDTGVHSRGELAGDRTISGPGCS